MSDTHNTRNYAAHGGGEWVIGGKLTVLEGATVEGLPCYLVTSKNGGARIYAHTRTRSRIC